MGRTVLVTGVCRKLGGRFARRLTEDPAVDRVVGVDIVPPRTDLGAVQFVRADIRNPVIAKVIAAEAVDTVVHLGVISTPSGAGGRTPMKEINVIGTMQLLAACQQARGIERLVVKSSARVYGSSSRDPAMFTEGMTPKRIPRSGFAKDSVEVEAYVRGFARRRPDVQLTTLRCANLIGPTIQTTLTRYFELPLIPTVLGFDPRLQFCHEDDALEALRVATVSDVDGTYNVAGDGVLMLSQAIRRLGRPSVALPGPALGMLGTVFPAARAAELTPEQTEFLTFGRGIDTSAARKALGFTSTYTTAEAFDTFARSLRPGALNAERIGALEAQLSDLLAKAGSRG
ncbi:MAG TPA: NAD-dependent epimerase/dehydratase family protein [Nocardioidaceae bacterium]|nr:NAD-dependent epimerase/dehydratase family protein [Nocardioidaceae bacterium]